MHANRGLNHEKTGLEPCFSSVAATVTAARSASRIPRETCGWGLILEKTVGHGTEERGCVKDRFVSLEDCSPKSCLLAIKDFKI